VVSQGILVLCLVGGVVAVGCHDWPDAVLIGLLGALSAVTARKMRWQLRQNHDPAYVGGHDVVAHDGNSGV
jgi:hypothetical protein